MSLSKLTPTPESKFTPSTSIKRKEAEINKKAAYNYASKNHNYKTLMIELLSNILTGEKYNKDTKINISINRHSSGKDKFYMAISDNSVGIPSIEEALELYTSVNTGLNNAGVGLKSVLCSEIFGNHTSLIITKKYKNKTTKEIETTGIYWYRADEDETPEYGAIPEDHIQRYINSEIELFSEFKKNTTGTLIVLKPNSIDNPDKVLKYLQNQEDKIKELNNELWKSNEDWKISEDGKISENMSGISSQKLIDIVDMLYYISRYACPSLELGVTIILNNKIIPKFPYIMDPKSTYKKESVRCIVENTIMFMEKDKDKEKDEDVEDENKKIRHRSIRSVYGTYNDNKACKEDKYMRINKQYKSTDFQTKDLRNLTLGNHLKLKFNWVNFDRGLGCDEYTYDHPVIELYYKIIKKKKNVNKNTIPELISKQIYVIRGGMFQHIERLENSELHPTCHLVIDAVHLSQGNLEKIMHLDHIKTTTTINTDLKPYIESLAIMCQKNQKGDEGKNKSKSIPPKNNEKDQKSKNKKSNEERAGLPTSPPKSENLDVYTLISHEINPSVIDDGDGRNPPPSPKSDNLEGDSSLNSHYKISTIDETDATSTQEASDSISIDSNVSQNNDRPKLCNGLREDICKTQGLVNVCVLCNTEQLLCHFENLHIKAVSDGGSNEFKNIICACRFCNVGYNKKTKKNGMGTKNLVLWHKETYPENHDNLIDKLKEWGKDISI